MRESIIKWKKICEITEKQVELIKNPLDLPSSSPAQLDFADTRELRKIIFVVWFIASKQADKQAEHPAIQPESSMGGLPPHQGIE